MLFIKYDHLHIQLLLLEFPHIIHIFKKIFLEPFHNLILLLNYIHLILRINALSNEYLPRVHIFFIPSHLFFKDILLIIIIYFLILLVISNYHFLTLLYFRSIIQFIPSMIKFHFRALKVSHFIIQYFLHYL